jgi:hypothetical protein
MTVRLFPPQAERLEELAEARGTSRSHILRELVLEATLPEDAPAVPSEDELLRLLGVAARMGRVPAIRLLLDHCREQRKQDSGSLAAVDELAQRRRTA